MSGPGRQYIPTPPQAWQLPRRLPVRYSLSPRPPRPSRAQSNQVILQTCFRESGPIFLRCREATLRVGPRFSLTCKGIRTRWLQACCLLDAKRLVEVALLTALTCRSEVPAPARSKG